MDARSEMQKIHIKQAVRSLREIQHRQNGLLNGNFSAIAKRYRLRVKELRQAYEEENKS